MIDDRDLLERALGRFEPQPGLTERVYRRRDRKRRNQRIAAGIVGIAVFVAAIWIVMSGGVFDRTQTPAVPGPAETGPAETGPPPARASAQSGAIDDEFRGWYRVRGSQGCPFGGGRFRDRVKVRYVSESVREITHAGLVWNLGLRYVRGERFPWQSKDDGRRWELRYDPATDTAVGMRYGLQGCEGVRLVPIG